jgi:NAD(P)-dependent dehydrogenase (short-subunit alcohol dehydrogenase family)
MRETDFRLDGRVAIVTGGGRGIGEAIARSFAGVGAKVVIASRNMENLERVASLAAKTVDKFGTIDILVNNAATNPYFGPIVDADENAWEKTVSVNLKGYFFMAQEAARVMIPRRSGKIINVVSVGGLFAQPMQGIYGITKAGGISLTMTLAVELAQYNIRVNAIAPGLTDTRFSSHLLQTKEILDRYMTRTPLKRYADPEEMTGVALLLASDASSFMTGAVIRVDGGSRL